MTTIAPENDLRVFIDEVYENFNGEGPFRALPALFAAVRKQFSFSSGTYLRFDPVDWTVTTSYMHDIGPDLMRQYSDHYVHLDPYRIHLPNLKRPNEVVRMSDFVNVSEVFRGEFGEAMRLVNYFHCMAIVPVIRGVPIGAFGVHRPRSKPDFSSEEQATFRWFVLHAARAMDYHDIVARLRRPDRAAMVIAPADRRVVALTEGARLLLSAVPDGDTVMLPADATRSHIWMVADRAYVARSIPLGPDSLLHSATVADLSFDPAPELTAARVRFPVTCLQNRVLVLIEPLDEAPQAPGRLAGYGLTPRQEQVALQLVLGKGIKEIARTCGISLNTAKEYVGDVYQRLDVHTRSAFLAKVMGIATRPGRPGGVGE